jgi:hypothetical protein
MREIRTYRRSTGESYRAHGGNASSPEASPPLSLAEGAEFDDIANQSQATGHVAAISGAARIPADAGAASDPVAAPSGDRPDGTPVPFYRGESTRTQAPDIMQVAGRRTMLPQSIRGQSDGAESTVPAAPAASGAAFFGRQTCLGEAYDTGTDVTPRVRSAHAAPSVWSSYAEPC